MLLLCKLIFKLLLMRTLHKDKNMQSKTLNIKP
jgi:hypothetical protein